MARLGLKPLVGLVLIGVVLVHADKPTGGYEAVPSVAAATVPPSVPGPQYGYDYNVGQAKDLGSSAGHHGSTSFTGNSGGYAQGGGWTSGSSNVEPKQPSPTYGTGQQGQTWTYHYEHYPGGKSQGGHYGPPAGEGWGSGGSGWSNSEGGLFGGFGEGFGGEGGFGGLGTTGTALAVIKGLIALKPFLLITLFVLIAIPLIVIYFPLPAISWSTPKTEGRQHVQSPTAIVSSYIAQLSEKFMKNDECFESIVCRIPPAPAKYQGKAKLLWEQYGKKYFTSPRVRRAMDSFFDETAGRSRIHKCNQKFKCAHNKYF